MITKEMKKKRSRATAYFKSNYDLVKQRIHQIINSKAFRIKAEHPPRILMNERIVEKSTINKFLIILKPLQNSIANNERTQISNTQLSEKSSIGIDSRLFFNSHFIRAMRLFAVSVEENMHKCT